MDARHRTDFYSWAMAQSELAKARSSNAFDWDNVAEELRLLGITEERELKSRLIVLIAHLLKWIVQPERRSRSWRNTIRDQRLALADHMASNPGLKSKLADAWAHAWPRGQLLASTETDIDVEAFPSEPPFTVAQAMDDGWWPADEPPPA